MTDSTKIILIVGVILIATGYVLLYTPLADILFVPKPKIPQPVRPVISMPRTFIPGTQEVVRKPETSEAEKAAPNIVATAEATVPKFTTLRDPFDTDFAYVRAAVAPGSVVPEQKKEPVKYLQLQGIFVSGSVKSAIIDDKVITVGSKTAGGFRVSEIRPETVVLKKAGKIKILRMK